MRDFVVADPQAYRDGVRGARGAAGLSAYSQPLMNWKLRQFASHRRDFDRKALRMESDPPPSVPEIPKYPGLGQEVGGSGRGARCRRRGRTIPISWFRTGSASRTKPRSRGSLPCFPDVSISASAAVSSPTIRRTRAGC